MSCGYYYQHKLRKIVSERKAGYVRQVMVVNSNKLIVGGTVKIGMPYNLQKYSDVKYSGHIIWYYMQQK